MISKVFKLPESVMRFAYAAADIFFISHKKVFFTVIGNGNVQGQSKTKKITAKILISIKKLFLFFLFS